MNFAILFFQAKSGKSNTDKQKSSKQWSPYGCHYYPETASFPQPNLDSLPKEPLKRGEQYFLDLAGNICKVNNNSTKIHTLLAT
jgi:ankyrin repeat domain-containing protein 6